MATGQFAGVYRQIGRLFRSGSVVGLTDGQLLDRFVRDRDDTAFEAIVARHGAMVLGVCRANLRDPNDIDDAFQATFLVLVKKADSLRHRDLLGHWLHGVAHRVARRARIDAAKRRDRVPTGPEPIAPAAPADDFDLRQTLHDEVNRLPGSYRAAIVLCYLEGRTHDEAALELGWPVGTVRGRLARARDLLRSRLTRRGLTLSTVTLTATLAESSEAAVPPKLIAITSRAVVPFATTVAATASPRVIALAGGVLHAMSATKLKLGLTLLVAAALTAPGVSAYQGPEAGKAAVKSAPTEVRADVNAPAIAAPADDRIRLAREAIKTLETMSRQGVPAQGTSQIPLWYRRLIDAQIEAGAPADATIREYLNAVKTAQTLAKARADAGQASSLDILSAQFDRAEAERFAASLRDKPRSPASSKAVSKNGLPPGVEPHGDLMGVGVEEPRLRKFPKQNPADESQNKAIEKALDARVPMTFPKETPLEDILNYIKSNTQSEPLDQGIPIYVDPVGLKSAQATLTTPVALDIFGIPLRTTLRLILQQIGLDYRVRDALLYISDGDSLATEDHERSMANFVQPPKTLEPAPAPEPPAKPGTPKLPVPGPSQ